MRLTTKRDNITYRRPIPPASAITAEESFTIDRCHRCGHGLTDKRVVVRFEEDIVLAALNPRLTAKTAAKQSIEQGWCSHCGQYAYASVRKIWAEPFDGARRQTQAALLLPEVVALCRPSMQDPKQLRDLKAGILEYQDCLFACLTQPNVPPDNNKAERALRKLVLKRKKSFGVKTRRGARTMEALYSVVQRLASRDKTTLLQNLHQAATA